MPARALKGRSVKSAPGQDKAGAADGHERAKDFLTAAELAALLEAAKAGRHGTRDHLLLMMMFRHGLRVSEAVSVRLDELDLDRSMEASGSVGRSLEQAEGRRGKQAIGNRSYEPPHAF